MEGYTCCICGRHFTDWGNDPWPVNMDDNAKCCDECDMTVVLQARLEQMSDKMSERNNA